MKQIASIIFAWVLGVTALMPQMASASCRQVTNSLSCPITICVEYGIICNPDVLPYGQQSCTDLPANSTVQVCIPDPPFGCQLLIMNITFTNDVTGESFSLSSSQSAALLAYLSGTSGTYVLPYTFTQGSCLQTILFTYTGDGFTMSPNTKEPCKKYCVRNESGCYVEVSITTDCLDDPCTDGIDYYNPEEYSVNGNLHAYLGDSYPNNTCLDFGFSRFTGCPLCLCDGSEVYFTFCGNHDCNPPCTAVSLTNIMSGGGANARICCGNHWLDLIITMDPDGTIVIKKK